MYTHISICTHSSMYQGCTRTKAERLRVRKFGTDRPAKDRNGERGEPERPGPERLRLGQAKLRLAWHGPAKPGDSTNGLAVKKASSAVLLIVDYDGESDDGLSDLTDRSVILSVRYNDTHAVGRVSG